MIKGLFVISCIYFSLQALGFSGDRYSAFHCAYLENEQGELKRVWSSRPGHLISVPEQNRFDDHGSIILEKGLAICLYAQGVTNRNMHLFINFYEGNNLNLAPGVCSFLGVNNYDPNASVAMKSKDFVYAKYTSLKSEKTYHLAYVAVDDLRDYEESFCKEIINKKR